MTRIIPVLFAAILLAACGGDDHGAGRVDIGRAERVIRPELQRQLRHRLADDSITVQSIDCVANSDQHGTCMATVGDDTGDTENLSIDLSIDPHSGAAIWKLDS